MLNFLKASPAVTRSRVVACTRRATAGSVARRDAAEPAVAVRSPSAAPASRARAGDAGVAQRAAHPRLEARADLWLGRGDPGFRRGVEELVDAGLLHLVARPAIRSAVRRPARTAVRHRHRR